MSTRRSRGSEYIYADFRSASTCSSMIESACGSHPGMLTRVSTPISTRSSGPLMSAPGDGAGAALGVLLATGAALLDPTGAAAGSEEPRLTAMAMPTPTIRANATPATIDQVILLFRIAGTVNDIAVTLNAVGYCEIQDHLYAGAAIRRSAADRLRGGSPRMNSTRRRIIVGLAAATALTAGVIIAPV